MTQTTDTISTVLKTNRLSITKQRLAVFRLLEGCEPMTMRVLYERAKDQMDRASLYRTISLFERIGVVQRTSIGWKYTIELTDKFAEHHHHLTCLTCGQVVAITEAELERCMSSLVAAHKFTAVAHQVEIQGYCAQCRS